MKRKIDLLINGNLVADRIAIAHSVRAEQSRAEQSRAEQSRAEQSRADIICDKNVGDYDVSEAIVIDGDVCVQSLMSPVCVLVTGCVATKGLGI